MANKPNNPISPNPPKGIYAKPNFVPQPDAAKKQGEPAVLYPVKKQGEPNALYGSAPQTYAAKPGDPITIVLSKEQKPQLSTLSSTSTLVNAHTTESEVNIAATQQVVKNNPVVQAFNEAERKKMAIH